MIVLLFILTTLNYYLILLKSNLLKDSRKSFIDPFHKQCILSKNYEVTELDGQPN